MERTGKEWSAGMRRGRGARRVEWRDEGGGKEWGKRGEELRNGEIRRN